MADLTFEQILEAAEKLSDEEKTALVEILQSKPIIRQFSITREQAIARLEQLRAEGAFNNVESLRGKYARPGLDVSEEELNTYLHKIGTEWEEELDDLSDED